MRRIPLNNIFNTSSIIKHLILLSGAFVSVFPVWMMLVNSLKSKSGIYKNPFGLPSPFTFDGYQNVLNDSSFLVYFRNSIFVTVVSILFILFLGSLAAYAIAYWRIPFTRFVYLFFIAGLMIPIRIGSINIMQNIKSLGLMNTIYSLFPIYIAMGLPIATFVLTEFIKELPNDLIEAAKIDGASRWHIYTLIIVPLIRPAMATVAIFNLIPIWNDLWFPLILIRREPHRTLILGISFLFGQYQTDWTKILAILTLASLPVLLLYIIMSKQFIKGLTAGAVKG